MKSLFQNKWLKFPCSKRSKHKRQKLYYKINFTFLKKHKLKTKKPLQICSGFSIWEKLKGNFQGKPW